jgi:hypothetical protein
VYVLTASVSVRYTGIVNLAKAISVQYFFAGLGALIGPIIAGKYQLLYCLLRKKIIFVINEKKKVKLIN